MNIPLEEYLINSLNLNKEISFTFFKHPNESRFKYLFDNIKPKKKR